MIAPDASRAQARAETPLLVMPPAFQIPPGSEVAFPMQVLPPTAIPKRSMILIRGLPSTIALSQGRLFESGVWGVPVGDLGALKITTTSLAGGRSDLSISLLALDGTLLAEARSSLIIGTPSRQTGAKPDQPETATISPIAPQQPQPPPSPEATSLAKRLTAEQTEQLIALVKKGDEQMRVGDVSAARLLYRHAAENGLGAGALALAATYDAQELAKYRVLGGVQPDPREAKLWYERARELGAAEARERLLRFGTR